MKTVMVQIETGDNVTPEKGENFSAYGLDWFYVEYPGSESIVYWRSDELSLKYDDLREEKRWTLIGKNGRIGDFDCSESALAKAALLELPNYRYKHQILHACERINSEHNGSYESTPSSADIADLVSFLSYRLATWQPSKDNSRFDQLCKELVEESVKLGTAILKARKDSA